jgi:hypothetical protein
MIFTCCFISALLHWRALACSPRNTTHVDVAVEVWGAACRTAAAAHEGRRSIDKAVGPIACACSGRDRLQPDQRDDADKPDDRASTIEPLASRFLGQPLHHDAFGDEARAVSVSQTSPP